MIKIYDFDSTLNSPSFEKKLQDKNFIKKFNENDNILITARDVIGKDQKAFIRKYGLKFNQMYTTGHNFYKVELLKRLRIKKDVEIHENNPVEVIMYQRWGYHNITIYQPVSYFDSVVNNNFKRIIKSDDPNREITRLWLEYGEVNSTAY